MSEHPTSRHAVVSGASIAGPALAHELSARGWRVTVLERAPQLRDEGQNVDIRGAAREVCRRMGIEEAVLAGGTGEAGLRYVDARGATIAELPAGDNDTDGATAEAEILRGELGRLLHDRTRDRVDYRFDEQIAGIDDRADGISVRLAGGETLEADVLVIAEGARSRTRATVFDDVTVEELGLHVAYLPVPRIPTDDRWWAVHQATGSRAVGLRPDNVGSTRAALTFISAVRGLETLDRDAQIEVLRRTFADVGWQADRVLDALDEAPFYFDATARVKIGRWSRGRTVLLGDAAWSAGPFGTGTSLALVGAHVLAGELAGRDDHVTAFDRFEQVMRPFVDRAQSVGMGTMKAMNPSGSAGLAVQRVVLRAAARLAATPLRGLVEAISRPPSDAVDLPDYPSARPAALAAVPGDDRGVEGMSA